MANLQQILAESSKSYDSSRNALNNQINAIGGQLQAQKDRINAQYAQQQQNLNNQRNWQAQADSMRSAGSGGSFGGSANIANKRYYQQAFVPALTQMQTNQANDMSNAESQAGANRLSLQNALARLNDEATRFGYQRYDQELAREQEAQRLAEQQRQFNEQMAREAEKMAEDKRRWEIEFKESQRRANLARGGAGGGGIGQYFSAPTYTQPQQSLKYVTYDGGDGNRWYKNARTGNPVRFGTYVGQFGGDFNANARRALADANADAEMKWLNSYLGDRTLSYAGGGGRNYYANPNANMDENARRAMNIMNRLGIYASGSW